MREMATWKINLDNGCTLITSNERNDYYVQKVQKNSGCDWYTVAVYKGTNDCHTMAGFSTKKVATECARHWAQW